MVSQARPAVPGLTPVAHVLHHEDRITQLEHENAQLLRTVNELRQTVSSAVEAIGILDCRSYRMRDELRFSAAVDIAHNDRLTTLERLGRVELGGEGWTP